MTTQKIITDKKKHREFLEVEVTRLWNLPQENPVKAKEWADMMYADILRISAEILDLENGIEFQFDEFALAKQASKYYQLKLKQETEFQTRCDIIHTANFWTLLGRALKGGK